MLLQGLLSMGCLGIAWLLQLTLFTRLPWLDGPLNLTLLIGSLLLFNIPRLWLLLLVLLFHHETDLWNQTEYYHLLAATLTLGPFYLWLNRPPPREQPFGVWQQGWLCVALAATYEILLALTIDGSRGWFWLPHLLSYLPLFLVYHLVGAWFLAPIFRTLLPRLQYRQLRIGTRPLA